MNDNSKKKIIIKYAASAAVALAITALTAWASGLVTGLSAVEIYSILSDAFAAPGLLYILFAALLWISGEGFFDMLSFGASRAAHLLIPMLYKEHKYEKFYEYKERKTAEREKKPSFASIFFVGFTFLAISGIFVILFYCN